MSQIPMTVRMRKRKRTLLKGKQEETKRRSLCWVKKV